MPPEDQDPFEPESSPAQEAQGSEDADVANATNDSWTDDTRPHGTPADDGTASHWDANLRAWIDTGVAALEPEPLDEATLAEVEQLFDSTIERDMQYPLLIVRDDPSIDVQLNSFAYHHEARLKMLGMAIRGRMKERYDARGSAASPYDRPTRNQFKFDTWINRAHELRRTIARQRRRLENSGAHHEEERARRRARAERRRASTTTGELNLTPDQMMQSESLLMRAAGHMLSKRSGRIWYDDFLHDIVTDWKCDGSSGVMPAHVMTNFDIVNLMAWLHAVDPDLTKINRRGVKEAMMLVADTDHRHCVRQWVGALPQWDGHGRLERLMSDGFKCELSDYTKRLGQNWLVAMIARVVEPGCKVDFMPVFYGEQGEQKTKALQVLVGEDWYDDVTEKSDNKDFLMKLRGKWLIEIAEMHSIASSRSEQAHVKAMLTRQEDRFRPPYGEVLEAFKRQMVFAGTTNRDDWHTDDTGGRRYAPVKCLGRIDLDWIRSSREQLFAEAMELYRDGWAWWELPAEQHAQALREQQAYGAHDNTIAGWIERALQRGTLWTGPTSRVVPRAPDVGGLTLAERWGNLMTTDRVIIEWLGLTMDGVAKYRQDISSSLRRMGWQSRVARFGDGVQVRHWVLRRPPEEGSQGVLALVHTTNERDVAESVRVTTSSQPDELPDELPDDPLS